ncbi:MAG TPA: dockerin type I domain-containing protein [Planctomycetota bacterium]|nr:dockerin type I domain-containing protein [Planctomycetota bacterium]
MSFRSLSVLCVFSSSLGLAPRTLAQPRIELSPGFEAVERLSFAPAASIGGLVYSPGGLPIVYDSMSGEVRLHAPGGSTLLARFEAGVFGSFLVLSPDETAVVFGENNAGNIYRIPLPGGDPVLMDHLTFNFDLAYDASGRGFVSAPGSVGNGIWLLDNDPAAENREVISNLGGASGPVAVDGDGNLYYGTVDFTLENGQTLLRFDRGLLDAAISSGPVDRSAGEVLVEEISGFYALKWLGGRLYFTDLGFTAGAGGLYRVDPAAAFSVSTLATFHIPEAILAPSFLAARPGARDFAAGAGPAGGALLVAYSDFSSLNAISEIVPETYFVRGRTNEDDVVDLSDAVAILRYLFSGGAAPDPLDAADVNDDGVVDLVDPVYLLEYLFRGGPVIPPPFPEPGSDP